VKHQIRKTVGSVVASDTQSSVAALDLAVVSQSRMCASVMEAAGDSKMPIGATQKLLEAMTSGLQGLAVSRADMVTAVRELRRIQADSSLVEEYFGCPGGPETHLQSAETAQLAPQT
jgi:hypothetical protein